MEQIRFVSKAEIAELEDPKILHEYITEGTWAGMPNFLCPCCMHAYLDKSLCEEHLRAVHIAPVLAERTAKTPGVGLFDANGHLIAEQPHIEEKE